MVFAYSAVCAGTQLLWLTYAPIDTGSARYYGVSSSAIGWLANVFPLLYVVLAIPAGRLLDSRFRPALAGAGVLMATGGVVRLGGQAFAWAMAGQLMIAVAQPVVLSAMGKLAGEYLPVERRPAGIAFASAASFAGMLFALVLGPAIGGHGHVERLLVVEAALGVPAALALVLALRRPGPAGDDEESAAIEGGAARALWALPEMRTMCGLVFVGFGVFVALTTWLQTLLHPSGVSEQAAGALLVGMLVAGMVGSAVLPSLLARRGAEPTFMRRAPGQRRRLRRPGGDHAHGSPRRGAGGDGPRAAAGFACDHLPSRAPGGTRRWHRRRDRLDGRQPRWARRGPDRPGAGAPRYRRLPGHGSGLLAGPALRRSLPRHDDLHLRLTPS